MTRVGVISGGTMPPRRIARAGGFGVPSVAAEAAGVAASAALAPVCLLALQEAGPAEPDSGRARKRAAAALDELRGLQLDLLSGAADPARLARLAALAEAGPGCDPALGAVLREVSLRARLELARRGVASATGA